MNVRSWPIVPVKNFLNIAILNVPLTPESGHSDAIWRLCCWRHGVDHGYVRFWPKADIQIPGFLGVERKFGSERSRIA